MLSRTAAGKNGITTSPPLPTMLPVHPAFWKILSAFLLICLLIQQFSLRSKNTGPPGPALENRPSLVHQPLDPHWTFDWQRDGNNHGLSTEQCDVAFPDLWNEIDRSVQHWSDRTITPKDIELYKENDGGVRILIADQQLRIIRTKGLFRKDFRHRIMAVLHQLQRSIVAAQHTGESVPDTEFTVVVDDIPVLGSKSEKPGALWAFTRAFANNRHDNIWLVPDFHFWAAPPEAEPWETTQTMARKHDGPLKDKRPEVIWRGVRWTNQELRESLINATDGKTWANAKFIDWQEPFDKMPMDDFCNYRFTVNTEGRSWSARLINLLNCDSLLIVHDVEWIAHFYHILDTDVNCIRVERDFSDLEEQITYYNNHIDEAQRIADTARKTFRERYTTPAATACYWRKLVRSWASVAFKPEIMEPPDKKFPENVHHSKSGLRGISFEEFVQEDNTKDYPYHFKPKQPGQHKGGKPPPPKGKKPLDNP